MTERTEMKDAVAAAPRLARAEMRRLANRLPDDAANDYERLADQLHEFIASTPDGYEGVALLEAAEAAIRRLIARRDTSVRVRNAAEPEKSR